MVPCCHGNGRQLCTESIKKWKCISSQPQTSSVRNSLEPTQHFQEHRFPDLSPQARSQSWLSAWNLKPKFYKGGLSVAGGFLRGWQIGHMVAATCRFPTGQPVNWAELGSGRLTQPEWKNEMLRFAFGVLDFQYKNPQHPSHPK